MCACTCMCMSMGRVNHKNTISGDGLVGYDDWFTPSRSGVRFSVPVRFGIAAVLLFCSSR